MPVVTEGVGSERERTCTGTTGWRGGVGVGRVIESQRRGAARGRGEEVRVEGPAGAGGGGRGRGALLEVEAEWGGVGRTGWGRSRGWRARIRCWLADSGESSCVRLSLRRRRPNVRVELGTRLRSARLRRFGRLGSKAEGDRHQPGAVVSVSARTAFAALCPPHFASRSLGIARGTFQGRAGPYRVQLGAALPRYRLSWINQCSVVLV